jgi:26S proteasome regulatory subunit N2
MGLVMLGTADGDSLQQMIEHAHETEHEKIIRGYALGIAMLMYGCEEGADTLIEQLVLDKDPILRYGAMYTVALAYCGTANNGAIRRLLHMAVSDVSDDVRRAAVTALGFVLLQRPRECPDLVRLLAGSYNPHVRYGATLAVGISCAGSALPEAIDLLLPMTKDPVDFVRQGAMIALSMVLIQSSEAEEPRVAKVRALLLERVADKHEETMAKFGAILATGIMNAGGRNVTISLSSRYGHMNMPAIVGVAVFTQFWYWYPLTHFVTLAFTPTSVIGVNANLESPKWSFRSEAPPSRFAYPPDYTPPKSTARTKLSTAVLSTTKKAKKRADQKARLSRSQPGMDTSSDDAPATVATEKTHSDEKADSGEKSADESEQKSDGAEEGDANAQPTAPEPTFEVKENPARITPRQVQFVRFDNESRYLPVKKQGEVFGIVMLRDTAPDQPVVLANANTTATATATTTTDKAAGGGEQTAAATADADGDAVIEDAEPAPPAAFEFDDDDDEDEPMD